MHRLPVLRTALDAYVFVWQERRDFLLLAFPAIAVLTIVGAVMGWLWWPQFPASPDDAGVEAPGGGAVLAVLVLVVINAAVIVMFAVAWHRRYLLPHEATTVGAAIRWRWRQMRFLLLGIAIGVLAGLVYLVASVFVAVVTLVFASFSGEAESGDIVALVLWLWIGAVLLALPLMLLIYGRLSMLFPSTAVDHRMSFRECWAFTRGNGWRLGLIIVVAAIPAGAIMVVVNLPLQLAVVLSGLLGSLTINLVLGLIQAASSFIATAVGVSALSIAYRELMGASAAAAPA